MSENHGHDVPALRAEREPDANFLGALRGGVRNDAVHADGGEDQRERAEGADDVHGEALLDYRIIDQSGEGRDIREWQNPNRRSESPSRAAAAVIAAGSFLVRSFDVHGQQRRPNFLGVGHEHFGIGLFAQGEAFGVRDDADDGRRGIKKTAGADLLADGVGVGPETFGHGVVDDSHGQGSGGIGFGEIAAAQESSAGWQEKYPGEAMV